jgi:6-phosphogluconolactonase
VPAHQSGACWVVVSPEGRFAYVANTVSSQISQYRISTYDGSIELVASFASPSNPTDLYFSDDGRFLYELRPDQNASLDTVNPGINAFRVNPGDGSLIALHGVGGLPTGLGGLVAR